MAGGSVETEVIFYPLDVTTYANGRGEITRSSFIENSIGRRWWIFYRCKNCPNQTAEQSHSWQPHPCRHDGDMAGNDGTNALEHRLTNGQCCRKNREAKKTFLPHTLHSPKPALLLIKLP